MKYTIVHIMCAVFTICTLFSCSTSSDVASNSFIQKRKYRKGIHLSLIQKQRKSEHRLALDESEKEVSKRIFPTRSYSNVSLNLPPKEDFKLQPGANEKMREESAENAYQIDYVKAFKPVMDTNQLDSTKMEEKVRKYRKASSILSFSVIGANVVLFGYLVYVVLGLLFSSTVLFLPWFILVFLIVLVVSQYVSYLALAFATMSNSKSSNKSKKEIILAIASLVLNFIVMLASVIVLFSAFLRALSFD